MTEREKQIIGLVHREVKPALGCTEPIAVALAVAKAVETLIESEPLDRMTHELQIKAAVSGNIVKTGMGVNVLETGMIGYHIATWIGDDCGNKE